jgi:hypothetical protein
MIEGAESSQILGPTVKENQRRIYASLDTFTARRLIDAGQYQQAVQRMYKALFASPRIFIRYWYKAVQASAGMIGLEKIFIRYRELRRKIQYTESYVVVGKTGAKLITRTKEA